MTSKISTVLNPNIFITNNYEIVKEYFLQDNYFRIEQLPQRKGQSLLITGGGGNKYLQSFEFSYNYDTTDKLKVVMEFVDTDGNFEQEFFGFNLNNAKTSIANRFKQLESNKISQNTEALDKFDIENYVNSYNRLFIAFGCGNDLRNWSDVHVVIAHDISVDISNGIRKYRYTFFPSTSAFFKPKLIFNLDSPNPQREFLFTDNIDGIFSYVEANDQDKTNDIVYKVLKKYISDVTMVKQDNIIVVLPDLISILKLPTAEVFEKMGIEIEVLKNSIVTFVDSMKKRRGIRAVNNAQLSQIEANAQLISEDKTAYVLKAKKPKITDTSNPELNPNFPDFYFPLNKINSYLKGVLNTVDNLVAIEETNSKILKFFESKKLIKDASQRCIILGLEGMINEYVYRNYIPGDELNNVQQAADQILKDFKPSLLIMPSNEKTILLDKKSYGLEFINTISRRKTSSNFFEKTVLDELAINEYGKKISEAFKVEGNIFELFDIPVFTNNLKNSNVLEINLTESSMYLAGISLTVQNNFHKFYVSEVQKNIQNITIGGVAVTSVFDEYLKILTRATQVEAYDSSGNVKSPDLKKDFDLLKKALVQHFFIAGKLNQNPLRTDGSFNYYKLADAGKTGTLEGNEFEIIKKSLPYAPQGFAGVGLAQNGELNLVIKPDGSRSYDYTNKGIELAIARQLGFDRLLTSEEIGNIFENETNRTFINSFLHLIVANGGDFNTDLALLALAINTANDGEFNKVNSNFNLKQKQDRVFQFAAILGGLFNINSSLDPEQALKGVAVFKNNGVLFTPKDFGLSQEAIAAELFNHLNRYGYKINIKTLPFFHLTSFRTMTYKPCYLFSKKILLNNDRTRKLTGNDLDFFSGAYNIAAFKHVISTKECYSEFLLENVAGTTYDV